MSFSGTVKQEIARQISDRKHCLKAEAAAIISANCKIMQSEDRSQNLTIQSENELALRKCFTIIQKAYNIEEVIQICSLNEASSKKTFSLHVPSEAIEGDVHRNCCKKAFLRGAFLASGSMSDPNKGYHFEIVCQDEEKAIQLQSLMSEFGVDAKIVIRKKSYVVYVKEGSQIVDMLAIMGANVSLMDFENVRIVKEMRNTVNRKVNCETANINKTVNAAVKQRDDILHIQERMGFQNLAKGLAELAELRLQYPEATLKELGMMLDPKVGKSGVNHRLRKLSEIAEDLRIHKEELL